MGTRTAGHHQYRPSPARLGDRHLARSVSTAGLLRRGAKHVELAGEHRRIRSAAARATALTGDRRVARFPTLEPNPHIGFVNTVADECYSLISSKGKGLFSQRTARRGVTKREHRIRILSECLSFAAGSTAARPAKASLPAIAYIVLFGKTAVRRGPNVDHGLCRSMPVVSAPFSLVICRRRGALESFYAQGVRREASSQRVLLLPAVVATANTASAKGGTPYLPGACNLLSAVTNRISASDLLPTLPGFHDATASRPCRYQTIERNFASATTKRAARAK
jgi:hypothetical protein